MKIILMNHTINFLNQKHPDYIYNLIQDYKIVEKENYFILNK